MINVFFALVFFNLEIIVILFNNERKKSIIKKFNFKPLFYHPFELLVTVQTPGKMTPGKIPGVALLIFIGKHKNPYKSLNTFLRMLK